MISTERLQTFIPFEDLSAKALEELIPHFKTQQFKPKAVVFKRNQPDEYCHYLLSGTLDLIDEDFQVSRYEGEDEANILALDATHPSHKFSAVAVTDCEVAMIPRRYISLISTWIELALSDDENEDNDWLETLLTSDLFNRVPPGNIQQLLSRFEEREVTLGDVLIREGDEGNECYVIKEGRALVTRGSGRNEETLAALSNGALFGEDSLISELPRSATITMTSDGVVMVLSKEDFNTLLKTPVVEYIKEDKLPELIEDSDTGVVLLDVRTEQEAEQSPIPRARNIPLAKLRNHLDDLNKNFIYVVQGEGRAEAAAYVLSEDGFNVMVLQQ
ncbi:cyclic nucleotide-binding domain-containing protein [Oceanobacter mangrovi]|uniref:cyclic nucleotide-binding domain-containing protein n=1 Tax=Oceanobacter mangrovi TaxID=2862510 RepID=UPI001C8CFE66|nr:cyclic nucleotide-binding domain-containing protein [Oceanobacter mangrovi]